jgi:hypothetical protein
MDLIVKEAIQIEFLPYNINRDGGFCLSKSGEPLIGTLKFFGTQPMSTAASITSQRDSVASYC